MIININHLNSTLCIIIPNTAKMSSTQKVKRKVIQFIYEIPTSNIYIYISFQQINVRALDDLNLRWVSVEAVLKKAILEVILHFCLEYLLE